MTTPQINTHFVLVVIAIIVSCLGGFWTIPLALAALVFSLRASDLMYQERTAEAKNMAWWAGLFGWLTLGLALIPILLVIIFSSTILALLGAAIAAG